MSGCGFPAPGAEIFQFSAVLSFSVFGLDFQITKITFLMVLAVILIVGFFTYAFRRPKLVPRGAQNVGELGYLFVRDGIAREIIGKDGDKFVPFLFSFFFFIWLLNFWSIVPFAQIPVTSIFAIPVAFALLVYVTWVPLGVYKQGFRGFFGGIMFPPGVPKAMYILLTPIELISNLIVRPFTHSVRLFANLLAGHLLIIMAAGFSILVGSFVGVVAIPFGLFFYFFEWVLIAGLQAFIFAMLSGIYIGFAVEHAH
jgi:F-type H+-transporting ATPase subunit a